MNPTLLTSVPRGRSPVWQTLAIVVILIVGLAVATAILRLEPAGSPPAEEAHAEHEAHGEGGQHVEMNAAKLKNAGLVIEEAGPHSIRTTLPLAGKVAANDEMTAHVSPRFPGIVKSVRKRLGDPVAKGEVLAVVESNDSLRSYEVKSEIAGTVTAKDVTLGELVNDQRSMFTVTDLSSVYVDLNVYRGDFGQLKAGQKVLLDSAEDALPPESVIDYLSPFGAENTQTMLARVVAPNPRGELRPGLFVKAAVVIGEAQAPVAVRAAAIQMMEQKPVIFVQEGDGFEARPVEAGRRDAAWVEILSGVQPGDKYVAGNSFLLKAELGKEGAAHED